eukprot:jgi/Undpi1/1631/HiC_scaffold_11.g05021.m1
MTRASVTRHNDGARASIEASGLREGGARRASAPRDTASSKAAVKPTTVVATTKRIVPDNKRPSTRSQPADLEKADGMSRRLRSAGRVSKEAAPAVAAGGRGKVVPEAAGVASRTRQAAAVARAAAARGGGKVVARKRWV